MPALIVVAMLAATRLKLAATANTKITTPGEVVAAAVEATAEDTSGAAVSHCKRELIWVATTHRVTCHYQMLRVSLFHRAHLRLHAHQEKQRQPTAEPT